MSYLVTHYAKGERTFRNDEEEADSNTFWEGFTSAAGLCSRTIIQSRGVSPMNGSKKAKDKFWSGIVKVMT